MYQVFDVTEERRKDLTREAKNERLAREFLAGQKASDSTYWLPQQVLHKLLHLLNSGAGRGRGESQVTMQPIVAANTCFEECCATA